MTKIQWTDTTWNPVTGCTKISAGCQRCYAERMSKRLRGRFGYPADEPFRVTFHEDRLDRPQHWRKPRRVFVCSMSDLFHESVTELRVNAVYEQMNRAPQHTYQILTKRAWRLRGLNFGRGKWVGVSVESDTTTWRMDDLARASAEVRYVSFEPLLCDIGEVNLNGMGWAIIGCESGPGARPCSLDWIRKLKDQCVAAGVPVFIKQARINGKLVKMPEIDGRVWDQYPEAAR